MSDDVRSARRPAGVPGPIELTSQELSNVERYRQLRQTSVRVILFTDLTERRGERAALELLQRHDEILVTTIEEENGGLVVKHIGDSVMAVFSEPSTAVERALRIQERIRAYNGADADGLQVRIGLHMGQVAVENRTQLDLFGRHVNRASRVEGLADAGQIFLTCPVFDSARGWLSSGAAGSLACKSHGRFRLKGIAEPVEIYEVVDTRHAQPRPPKPGRRARAFPPLLAAAALLVAGAAIAAGVLQIRRTEVWFEQWPDIETIVDQKEKLVLEGAATDARCRAVTRLRPGTHLLRQDIHWQVKNWMTVDIRPGKNVIENRFQAAWMPSREQRLEWDPDLRRVSKREEFACPLYDAEGKRTDHEASIELAVGAVPDPSDRNRLISTVEWTVVLDGKTISSAGHTSGCDTRSDGTVRHDQVLWEDGQHSWYLRSCAAYRSVNAEVGAAYIEYKD